MTDYINYINGKWLSESDSKISIYDGGFLLGDGLFETIRFDNKNLFCIDKHLDRLNDGLDTIRIKLLQSNTEIKELLNNIIKLNSIKSGLLRLMITRGYLEGPPWKFDGPANIYITIRPFSKQPTDPVEVIFYSENDYPIIRYNPAIKSLNYIGNMLAKKDADIKGAYEPVFYNKDGYITECAIRNIFFIKNNTLLTPNTTLGVLPGVMRSIIIDLAKKINLNINETYIPYKDIDKMDEAFISSTGIGLLPCLWEGWNSSFSVTNRLQNNLNKIIENNKILHKKL